MRLDYQPKNGNFILWVTRGEVDPAELMRDHGLDMSLPASTREEACLFTREPYAAAAFGNFATPAALEALEPILREIRASWALKPERRDWPAGLVTDGTEPYPLQLANLEYALRRQHTLVADEPGVGKTLTAIMYANMLAWEHGRPDKFRGLAIVPASIRMQWRECLARWCTIPDLRISVASNSLRGVPADDNGTHWTVLSYDTARNRGIEQALLRNTYDVVVLDEAHYLKSPSARRTRAILGASDRGTSISSRAVHILALTGTPIPNRPREAFVLAKACCPEAVDFMSERAFVERFNPRRTIKSRYGKVVAVDERVGRYHELQSRLRACFMVRHLKRDAMPQLRLPVYDLVYADETTAVRAALAAERLLDIDPETFTGIDGGIDGAVSTARKMMGLALAPQAAAYVRMLVEGGTDKVVVFAWHIEVMDFLQKALDNLGVVRVDGSTTERGKAQAVLQFQQRSDIAVILGNVLSLGTGTDGLQQVCGHAVIVEADWVHGNNVQCIDRLDRGGQTRQVIADIFVAKGSLSEHVLATALRKGSVVHKSLDGRM